jgi:hypothetical protein
MKLQDVLLRAMAKKISWWQAAEIIGVTVERCGAGGNDWKNTATAGRRRGGKVGISWFHVCRCSRLQSRNYKNLLADR